MCVYGGRLCACFTVYGLLCLSPLTLSSLYTTLRPALSENVVTYAEDAIKQFELQKLEAVAAGTYIYTHHSNTSYTCM